MSLPSFVRDSNPIEVSTNLLRSLAEMAGVSEYSPDNVYTMGGVFGP